MAFPADSDVSTGWGESQVLQCFYEQRLNCQEWKITVPRRFCSGSAITGMHVLQSDDDGSSVTAFKPRYFRKLQ